MNIGECIDLKNSLSEEATHMKNSLIPNLMLGLQENVRTKKDLKLFEIEKAFFKK
jgi:phenylalanyl-tRNA synthetase beta subunit